MNKGQLTINTIIVAALALVVLVVLFGIFTGQMGKWVEKVTQFLGVSGEGSSNTCQKTDGSRICAGIGEECPSGKISKSGTWTDCIGRKCCE